MLLLTAPPYFLQNVGDAIQDGSVSMIPVENLICVCLRTRIRRAAVASLRSYWRPSHKFTQRCVSAGREQWMQWTVLGTLKVSRFQGA
jgi:hypothetical protein